MADQIKGWRVIRAEWKEKGGVRTPKWTAMSRVFVVRSAADKYAELARKDEADPEDIAVETVYV